MLPAAPSSCAGWWFAQLWQALLRRRPDRHTTWLLSYPEPGELRLHSVVVPGTPTERIAGSLHGGAERRCMAAWEWPGEDGMFHSLRLLWQPGEVIVRPVDWARVRQPFHTSVSAPDAVPWPLRVRIRARGWHGQTLERAELEAADGPLAFPLHWEPPLGEPRLPVTDLPCSLTMLDRQGSDGLPALSLAGLTLPWRIDLDRDAWAIWRRLSAGDLLRRLGGPEGICPRHGRPCPWPITGRISAIG